MMKYNDFEEVVTKLYNFKLQNDKYMENIPSDINEFVYANTYVENLLKMYDTIAKKYFGDMYEDINWFIYELTDNIKAYENNDNPNIISANGAEYWINNLETYLSYARIELFDNLVFEENL